MCAAGNSTLLGPNELNEILYSPSVMRVYELQRCSIEPVRYEGSGIQNGKVADKTTRRAGSSEFGSGERQRVSNIAAESFKAYSTGE